VLKRYIEFLLKSTDVYTSFDDRAIKASVDWFAKQMKDVVIDVDTIDNFSSYTYRFTDAPSITIGYVSKQHMETAIAVLGSTIAVASKEQNQKTLDDIITQYSENYDCNAYTVVNMLKTIIENT